jgi:hypothetical protein
MEGAEFRIYRGAFEMHMISTDLNRIDFSGVRCGSRQHVGDHLRDFGGHAQRKRTI